MLFNIRAQKVRLPIVDSTKYESESNPRAPSTSKYILLSFLISICCFVFYQNYSLTSKTQLLEPVSNTSAKQVRTPLLQSTESVNQQVEAPVDTLSRSQHESQPITVSRVIDGDTFVLTNGEQVRLIGVDTPEIRNSLAPKTARAATAFTTEFLKKKSVVLSFDSTSKHRDPFGRLLVYVETPTECLNSELLKAGLGFVPRKFRFTRKMEFLVAESQAQRDRIGLWSCEEVAFCESFGTF